MSEAQKQQDQEPASLPVEFTGQQSSIIERAFASENFDQIIERCNFIASSDFVPNSFKGSGANVLMALELGRSIGISATSSLQHIAFVNNRPTVWGDALPAVVKANGGDVIKREIGEPGAEDWGFEVTVTRPGSEPVVETFTVADAKRAGLWEKSGPWKQYTRKMLFYRARAFAIREQFADVLSGVAIREEVEDYIDVTPSRSAETATTRDAPPATTRSQAVLAELQQDDPESPASPSPSVDQGGNNAAPTGEAGDLIPDSGADPDDSAIAAALPSDGSVLGAARVGDLFGKCSTANDVAFLSEYVKVNAGAFSDEEMETLRATAKEANARVKGK